MIKKIYKCKSGKENSTEVGVNLQKHFMITYEFDKNQGLSTTDFKDVRVGFTTKTKQGILMQIQIYKCKSGKENVMI
jgi:hypothetical protein